MTEVPVEYDYAEAARLLRVSEDWLRHETPGRFPHRKLAGKVRFSPDHIEAIRAMHEVQPAAVDAELRPVGRRRSA